MTYTFKLSRRLAVGRFLPVCGIVLAAACDVDPMDSGPAPAVRELALSPARATAEPYQRIKMAFRDQVDGDMTSSYDVTWTVLGGGGSIAPDGSFTATEPGTYQIVGVKGKGNANPQGQSNGNGHNKPDTSVVVVVPPPVSLTGVELSPGSASLQAGEHMQFEAVGVNDDGSTSAIGVEWSATGGSIDAGGHFIAGSSGGTYRVVAKHTGSGFADTADVSVTEQVDAPVPAPAPAPEPTPEPSLPPELGGNQPADFIVLSNRAFRDKVEAGWTDRGDANFSIVADNTSPESSDQVGQALFPKGFPSGSGPIATGFRLSGQRELYLSFWIKVSDNWYGNDAGVNKIFFIWMHGKPVVYLSAQGAGAGSLEPQIRLQDTPQGSLNLRPNATPIQLERGRWHHWELVLEANTPGAADGTARWWIDGVKAGEHSGLAFAGAGQSNAWESVVWNPTYGGSGAPVPADQWMRIDHAAIAGR